MPKEKKDFVVVGAGVAGLTLRIGKNILAGQVGGSAGAGFE
jgi:hypothetical protein